MFERKGTLFEGIIEMSVGCCATVAISAAKHNLIVHKIA
jgi:hypothetical protein